MVTNPTNAKAMCAICLLACVVQVWSSDEVVNVAEPPKESGPYAPIVVLTDLG